MAKNTLYNKFKVINISSNYYFDDRNHIITEVPIEQDAILAKRGTEFRTSKNFHRNSFPKEWDWVARKLDDISQISNPPPLKGSYISLNPEIITNKTIEILTNLLKDLTIKDRLYIGIHGSKNNISYENDKGKFQVLDYSLVAKILSCLPLYSLAQTNERRRLEIWLRVCNGALNFDFLDNICNICKALELECFLFSWKDIVLFDVCNNFTNKRISVLSSSENHPKDDKNKIIMRIYSPTPGYFYRDTISKETYKKYVLDTKDKDDAYHRWGINSDALYRGEPFGDKFCTKNINPYDEYNKNYITHKLIEKKWNYNYSINKAKEWKSYNLYRTSADSCLLNIESDICKGYSKYGTFVPNHYYLISHINHLSKKRENSIASAHDILNRILGYVKYNHKPLEVSAILAEWAFDLSFCLGINNPLSESAIRGLLKDREYIFNAKNLNTCKNLCKYIGIPPPSLQKGNIEILKIIYDYITSAQNLITIRNILWSQLFILIIPTIKHSLEKQFNEFLVCKDEVSYELIRNACNDCTESFPEIFDQSYKYQFIIGNSKILFYEEFHPEILKCGICNSEFAYKEQIKLLECSSCGCNYSARQEAKHMIITKY